MAEVGYTGISYPFRISSKGGVVMSTTSKSDATHISESIQQIFNTGFLERPMESDVYTTVTSLLFEPNNVTLQQVLAMRIINDLERLDDRISVSQDSINFEVETDTNGIDYLYAYIHYNVVKYSTSKYTAKVKVGEVINE